MFVVAVLLCFILLLAFFSLDAKSFNCRPYILLL